DNADALQNAAWILATHPQAPARNGTEALALAQRALELSGGKDARFWAALDVAYGELGQFDEAIRTAGKTKAMALDGKDDPSVRAAEQRLASYRAGRAFHQE